MIRPAAIERQYRRALLEIVNRMEKLWRELFLPHLPALVQEAAAGRPSADSTRINQWPEEAARLVETLKLNIGRGRIDPERLAEGFGDDIGTWNDRQWRRVLVSVLGVDLFIAEPWLRPELAGWAKVNASLITSLEDDGIRAIERWTLQGLRTGQRHEQITAKIQEVFGRDLTSKLGASGMRARAKLIARDQVSKLNADLTKHRQQAAGVTGYLWRTSLDERVRGNPAGKYPDARPSHWAREGKPFKWNNPPEDGHPGTPINCRCTAEPDMAGLLAAAEE
jgi:SPP1 gp7 family putative phage head morphogenesis protein